MSGVLNLPVDGACRLDATFWWPTIPSGYYDFSSGMLTFLARDKAGEVVLNLMGGIPDAYANIVSVQSVDSEPDETGGVVIPAGYWMKLHLAAAYTALYATQTLYYAFDFAPTTEDPFGLLRGELQITGAITVPEVWNL